MVHLVRGQPHAGDAPKTESFRQSVTSFRSRVSSASGSVHEPEKDRYHLVVALPCPFAHRTLIMRSLKGLQDAITVDYVYPELTLEHGWVYSSTGKCGIEYSACARERSGLQPQAQYLYQLYQKGNPEFTGTITVPILWDKKLQTVVNNDSGQIMEMLNSEFDELCSESLCPDLFPKHLQEEINQLNDYIFDTINTGVYKCGLATSQEDYEAACLKLFAALDKLEQHLEGQRYLIAYYSRGQAAPSPTLADYRLFTTLIRFDVVYYLLFKANIKHIRDYPNLQGFMEDLHSNPAVSSTVDFGQIKNGYWWSMNLHGALNPKDRVPLNSEPFALQGPLHRRVLGLPEDPRSSSRQQAPSISEQQEQQQQKESKGAFVRGESQHRNWIRADGSSQYKPEKGRYHLYIANNCPWCHRTAVTRALLGMQGSVTMDVLFYQRHPDRGWQFKPDAPGCTRETVNGGIQFIRELYERLDSKEKSVPILFDKKTMTIVSNESADIIRMFATECQALHGPDALSLIPADPQQMERLEEVNAWVYNDIANGAYKAGFASTQHAYEAAYTNFFSALDRAELLLSQHRYLLGDTVSEADVRLFPTIFRFDHVYYLRFLLEKAMIVESYPNLQRWMMDFYMLPGVADASCLEHCKKGYFGRHGTNIVPLGPKLKYSFRQ